jgi:integrase
LRQSSLSRISFHDTTSSTHDRGYAGEESLIADPSHIPAAGFAVCTPFQQVTRDLGPDEIRSYQVYLTNERKLAPSSIIIAVAALRFLYKITLHKDWDLAEVIPTPKKPHKLPIVLSPEEVLKFLARVRSLKHRTILTICYAAGMRVSEAVCLKVTDVDSQRMVIRVEHIRAPEIATSCSPQSYSKSSRIGGEWTSPKSGSSRAIESAATSADSP